jgi:hypothetical protein
MIVEFVIPRTAISIKVFIINCELVEPNASIHKECHLWYSE